MRCSRSLLFPGAQPPLSHFGATLLRHTLDTGLRYTCFHLGYAMPESSPLRLIQLRPYVDLDTLQEQLGEAPGGGELAAAWVDPGGTAGEGHLRLRVAAAIHRLRLGLAGRPSPPARQPWAPDTGRGELWDRFETTRASLQRRLNDALLAETVAVLARRRHRARGGLPEPCLGHEGWCFLAGRAARMECLGAPDPLHPSWAESAPDPPLAVPAHEPLPPRHRLRGRFREAYRAALDVLRPLYLALAERAARHGLLAEPRDAFFLPHGIAGDLASLAADGGPPDWLTSAVATNRSEYEALLACAPPPESFERAPGVVTTTHPPTPEPAALAPLV